MASVWTAEQAGGRRRGSPPAVCVWVKGQLSGCLVTATWEEVSPLPPAVTPRILMPPGSGRLAGLGLLEFTFSEPDDLPPGGCPAAPPSSPRCRPLPGRLDMSPWCPQ